MQFLLKPVNSIPRSGDDLQEHPRSMARPQCVVDGHQTNVSPPFRQHFAPLPLADDILPHPLSDDLIPISKSPYRIAVFVGVAFLVFVVGIVAGALGMWAWFRRKNRSSNFRFNDNSLMVGGGHDGVRGGIQGRSMDMSSIRNDNVQMVKFNPDLRENEL